MSNRYNEYHEDLHIILHEYKHIIINKFIRYNEYHEGLHIILHDV